MITVDERLVDAAKTFIRERFPTGTEGAAAMYLDDGQILLSTAPEDVNRSVALCHETGALCEAYKLGRRVVATVCVSRDEGQFHILTPCGVCQERLWLYGEDVSCGVPVEGDSSRWEAVPLKVLSPRYWRRPFL